MRQPGRPKEEIDLEQLEKLCELQCTQKEIAQFFRIHPETLKKRVEEHYDRKWAEVAEDFRGAGKCSLRRMQWKSASNGNVSMQIFLGKNILGQTDKMEKKVNTAPINIQFVKAAPSED